MMRSEPNKNWEVIKTWARPMNQREAGLFLNITGSTEEEIGKKIDLEGPCSDDLKLNLQWVDAGYIRIHFYVAGRIK